MLRSLLVSCFYGTLIVCLSKTVLASSVQGTRPGCDINQSYRYYRYRGDCSSDNKCKSGFQCCSEQRGGYSCQINPKVERPGCQGPSLNRICKTIVNQCYIDKQCRAYKICCHVLGCGNECIERVRPGVCPTKPPFDPDFCSRARVASNCNKDSDCTKSGQKCCKGLCESLQCKDPVVDLRCPSYRKVAKCKKHKYRCSVNDECGKGRICCPTPCGSKCKRPCPICEHIPKFACSKRVRSKNRRCKRCRRRIRCRECRWPKRVGTCNAATRRYYYDKKIKECRQYPFGGCGGNRNNFERKEDCELRCNVKPVCSLPPKTGRCKAKLPRYYYSQNSGECKQFIYGGCGGNKNNFQTKDECQGQCICSLPSDTGPCEALLKRYHYNVKSGECEQFTYGGCDGNRNNFKTKKECEGQCLCSQPPQRGTCKAYMPRYYFNPASGECVRFIYGGCGGNNNNFDTEEECHGRCTCSLPPKSGTCKAKIPRYYFNPKTGECKQFIYGGCGGNRNNFANKEDCEDRCSPEPQVICPDRSLPEKDIFCGRGPTHQDCRQGFSCFIDPTDRFAVCCPIPKGGECPEPNSFGICIDTCQGDSTCPGTKKCCSNGCGRLCTNPKER